jgi:hypothetical protein
MRAASPLHASWPAVSRRLSLHKTIVLPLGRNGRQVAVEAPLLGCGFWPQSVKTTAERKLPSEFLKTDPEMLFHAHGVLFDIFLQAGLIGLAVFMALLAALVNAAWRTRNNSAALPVGAAFAALVVAMLMKNASDDHMHHAVVIAFWGYAGVLVGRLAEPTRWLETAV